MKRRKRLEEDIARANRRVTRARKALDDATDFWDGAVVSTSTHRQAEAANAAIRRRLRGDQDGPELALPWREGAADSVLRHTRTVGLGDVVVTRQNAYDPITSTGNPVINGARWIVQNLSDDPDDEYLLLRNVKDGGEIYLNDGYWHGGTSHPPLIEGAWAAAGHRAVPQRWTHHPVHPGTTSPVVTASDPGGGCPEGGGISVHSWGRLAADSRRSPPAAARAAAASAVRRRLRRIPSTLLVRHGAPRGIEIPV